MVGKVCSFAENFTALLLAFILLLNDYAIVKYIEKVFSIMKNWLQQQLYKKEICFFCQQNVENQSFGFPVCQQSVRPNLNRLDVEQQIQSCRCRNKPKTLGNI